MIRLSNIKHFAIMTSSIVCINAFSVVTSQAGVLFRPTCNDPETSINCTINTEYKEIYIYDEITDKDFDTIAYYASQLSIHQPFPKIILNSYGGSTYAAMGIGRILRWKKASAITHDIFNPEHTPLCFSACVLVAAGAVERNLDVIGVHTGYSSKRIKGEQYIKLDISKETIEDVNSYYVEMGINKEIIDIEKDTPSDKLEIFRFELEVPLERQKIHQLGFRVRGSDSLDVERIGKRRESLKWSNGSLNPIAKTGDVDAQYRLGKTALHGLDGRPANRDAASYWLNKAADQDDIRALHLLGVTYSFGYDEFEIDKNKAFSYYLRAAKLGSGPSQNNLAWAYFKGEGVEKNLYEAIYWATKATERGDHFSYGTLGTIRFETDFFQHDDVETYMWLKLGTDFMPKGKSRDSDLKTLELLKSRMTGDQIARGDVLVKNWKPLKQAESQMRDKDD
jgi:TPR repeat protein